VGAEIQGTYGRYSQPADEFPVSDANKNLSTAEGGMVTTGDPALEEKLRVYHLHGVSRDAWKRYHTKDVLAERGRRAWL